MEITIDCTGDVVSGDIISFTESVFGGSHRKPIYLGDRGIIAEVLRDSYGADKQQHTFTLRVISSEGVDPLAAGTETRRKGRNVYKNGTKRARWNDEAARKTAADEKHRRGDAARAVRTQRQEIKETGIWA
jgi:hypothetical protein